MRREATPSAGVVDSQSVKNTESGGIVGYDAGKKIKGRKRHIVNDTTGLLVGLAVHGADIQDRDGAPVVLNTIRHTFPWLHHIFTDGGYAGPTGQRLLEMPHSKASQKTALDHLSGKSETSCINGGNHRRL